LIKGIFIAVPESTFESGVDWH